MGRNTNLQKFKDALFDDLDEDIFLTPAEAQQLKRIRAVFSISLSNPSTPDTNLRDYLISEFGISQTQAYRDIGNMRVLLPNVQQAAKEWHRYLVNEELKQVIEQCKLLGADYIKDRIQAVSIYAKYNKLNKEDALEYPWEDIKPQSIEPSSDVTILGVKPLANKEEEIKKMFDKYKGDIEIEDADYVDMHDEDYGHDGRDEEWNPK